jgi:hypothetical protein
MAYDRREQDLNEDKKGCTVSSRLTFTGCPVTYMLWKRSRVLGIGIAVNELGYEQVMTIARGEIDSTDRCQPSAVPLIVSCQIPFFIIPDYDASLPQRPSSMPLRRLLPLLSCPLCAAADKGGLRSFPLLRSPFTLHCGHTVCSSHLPTLDHNQRCPLPICSSTPNPNAARPNIPSSSRVVYFPAAPPPPATRQTAATSADQFEQLVDITVNKLLEVVSRHSPPPPPASVLEDSDHSDRDDEDAELQGPPTGRILPYSIQETEHRAPRDMRRSSGHRRRPAPELAHRSTLSNHSESTLSPTRSTSVIPTGLVQATLPSSPGRAGHSSSLPSRNSCGEASDGSDLSPEPPKKRLRRDSRALVTDQQTQSRAVEREAETSNPDRLNHPQQPTQPDLEPRQGPDEDLRARVDKELLTELSCEICFAIYYQPVTTPCQHVSLLVLRFVILFHTSPPDIRLEHFLGPSTDHPTRCRAPDVFIHALNSRKLSHLTSFV